MTRREAADFLRYTERTIDRLIRDGVLKARKFIVTRNVRIYSDSVYALAGYAVEMGPREAVDMGEPTQAVE